MLFNEIPVFKNLDMGAYRAIGIPDEAKPEKVKVMEVTTNDYGLYR